MGRIALKLLVLSLSLWTTLRFYFLEALTISLRDVYHTGNIITISLEGDENGEGGVIFIWTE